MLRDASAKLLPSSESVLSPRHGLIPFADSLTTEHAATANQGFSSTVINC